MRNILFLLLLPLSAFAQKIEFQKDGFICKGSLRYPTYTLSINNSSASDPAMVFVIPIKDFNKLKLQIPKIYHFKKQEYNEYYVLGVDNNRSQTKVATELLTTFLTQIDSSRVARKLSTFLRKYNWDNASSKITYKCSFKNLSDADNVYFLKSFKDICKYMNCPF